MNYLQVKKSCIEPLKNWGGGNTPVFKSKPSPGWYSCRKAHSDENNVLRGMTTESAYTDVTTPFKDRTGGRPRVQGSLTRSLSRRGGCQRPLAAAQHGLEQHVRLPLGDLRLLRLHHQVSTGYICRVLHRVLVRSWASGLWAARAWTPPSRSGRCGTTTAPSGTAGP